MNTHSAVFPSFFYLIQLSFFESAIAWNHYLKNYYMKTSFHYDNPVFKISIEE